VFSFILLSACLPVSFYVFVRARSWLLLARDGNWKTEKTEKFITFISSFIISIFFDMGHWSDTNK